MKLSYFLGAALTLSSAVAMAATPIVLPLHYVHGSTFASLPYLGQHPSKRQIRAYEAAEQNFKIGGFYTTDLYVGKSAQHIKPVLDTGSANLILLQNPRTSKCHGCYNIVNNSYYHIGQNAIPQGQYYPIAYGSGGSLTIAQQFVDYVGVKGMKPFLYKYSVAMQAKGMPDLWGIGTLINASPSISPMTPYVMAMNQHMPTLKNQFTLQLCAGHGPSQFVIGGVGHQIPSNQLQSTPIVSKSYYVVKLNNVSDTKTGQSIVSFEPHLLSKTAILDSGTPFIILTQPFRANLVNYMRTQLAKKNIVMPDAFWNKHACTAMPQKIIDSFPALSFNLAKWKHPGQSIHLSLTPEHYLLSQNCAKGKYFMGILDSEPNSVPPRRYPTDHTMILGAPFMSAFVTTFHPGAYNVIDNPDGKAHISFSSSDQYCKIPVSHITETQKIKSLGPYGIGTSK